MNFSYLNVATCLVGGFQQFPARCSGLATVMLGLIWLSVAQAEQSAGDSALFTRLDADNDERITTDEVAADQHGLFERLLRRGDRDEDGTLSHEEFLAALVPSRPDKTLETKRPSSSPEANAVRWLLLTMDTNGNGWIEAAEVPEELETTFESMEQRLDTDKNRILESGELIRGDRPLAQIARRVRSAKRCRRRSRAQAVATRARGGGESVRRAARSLGQPLRSPAGWPAFCSA